MPSIFRFLMYSSSPTSTVSYLLFLITDFSYDFLEASGDSSWKKLSQTLDAGAKIYGLRVDSVHTETYKVLGGLNRTDLMEGNGYSFTFLFML